MVVELPNASFNGVHGGVIRAIVIAEMTEHAAAVHMSRENPVIDVLINKCAKENHHK
jgi:hypothetical protein